MQPHYTVDQGKQGSNSAMSLPWQGYNYVVNQNEYKHDILLQPTAQILSINHKVKDGLQV